MPVLLVTRSASLHDAVVPLCAAAGVGGRGVRRSGAGPRVVERGRPGAGRCRPRRSWWSGSRRHGGRRARRRALARRRGLPPPSSWARRRWSTCPSGAGGWSTRWPTWASGPRRVARSGWSAAPVERARRPWRARSPSGTPRGRRRCSSTPTRSGRGSTGCSAWRTLPGVRWEGLVETAGRLGARALREGVPRRDAPRRAHLVRAATTARRADRATDPAGRRARPRPRRDRPGPAGCVRPGRAGRPVRRPAGRHPGDRAGAGRDGAAGRRPRSAGRAGLVVRPGGLSDADAERVTGLPVVAAVGDQRGLAASVDRGLGPLTGRGPLARRRRPRPRWRPRRMSTPVSTAVLDDVRRRLAGSAGELTPHRVAEALRASGSPVGDATVLAVHDLLRRDVLGAGPLEELLRLPDVTDVLVNGPDDVWIDRGGGLERASVSFPDDAAVRRLAQRLAASAGRRLDDATPHADVRLPDGTRFHAVLAPVARSGTVLSLRVPRGRVWTLPELVDAGRAAAGRRLPAGGGGRLAVRLPRDRRHRHGQDVGALGAAVAGRPGRADRAGRGRQRAAARPSARRRARGAAAQHRGRRARSRCRRSCGRRCGCGPTGWSSGRCAAPRSSTCWRRSTPVTAAAAGRSTPTPPPTSRPGSRPCRWPPGCRGRRRTASSRRRWTSSSTSVAAATAAAGSWSSAVPEREASGLVSLRTAATFEPDRVVRGPAAGALAARLGSVAW